MIHLRLTRIFILSALLAVAHAAHATIVDFELDIIWDPIFGGGIPSSYGIGDTTLIQGSYDDGLISFTADSDAVITKGIVSLLIRVLDSQSPDDILQADLSFVEKIGLRDHLSPTRSNGLTSMIKQIKLYAMAYKAREQSQ